MNSHIVILRDISRIIRKYAQRQETKFQDTSIPGQYITKRSNRTTKLEILKMLIFLVVPVNLFLNPNHGISTFSILIYVIHVCMTLL